MVRLARVLVIVLLLSSVGCGAQDRVRPPTVAGAFYERAPFGLDKQVERLLQEAVHPVTTGRLVAAVAPHAGYVYSGPTAAAVYAVLKGERYDRVILLGPSHHEYVKGVSLPDPGLTVYSTPLGYVPLDVEVCKALQGVKGFVVNPAAAVREHSLEVQLPFLQKALGSFRLIPLICGPLREVDVAAVSAALAPYMTSNTLLVASSDFTHYGSNYGFEPFSADAAPKQLREWLARAAGAVAALDEVAFARHCEATRDTICGEIPIRILMATLNRSGARPTGQVLALSTSADRTGDYRNAVSYAGIGFFGSTNQVVTKEGKAVKEHRSGTWTPGLTDAEKTTLFAIARDTLAWCVNGGKGKFDFSRYTITPLMKSDMATFVTLKIRGDLRGCIGSLAPVAPLYQSVHDNAVNAALRDPRFEPVGPSELPRIEVDVSVLSPIRDIASVADFKLGQQGIIIEKGHRRAVYLPEVAVEQKWSVEETLSSLSMKAGLPSGAWREGARFQVFESVVLSE